MNFMDEVSVAIATQRNALGYFYVIFQSYCDIEEDTSLPYKAVSQYNPLTKTFKIKINSQQLDITNHQELIYVISHEFFHILMGHFSRDVVAEYDKKSKEITNIILDCQINSILNEIFYPDRYATLILEKESESKKANTARRKKLKEYEVSSLAARMNGFDFDILQDELEKDPKNQWYFKNENLYDPIESWFEELDFLYKNQGSKSLLSNGGGRDVDDHSLKQGSIEDNTYSEELIKSSLNSLLQEARQKSEENGDSYGLDSNSLFNRFIKINTDVKKTLSIPSIMGGMREATKQSTVSTYTRYNIMNSCFNYPKKAYYNEKISKVVAAIDISGSITEDEKDVIIRKLMTIKNDIDLIFWSSENKISDNNVYKNFNKKTHLTPTTTGGTSFEALFRYVEDQYKKTTLCIFSDFCVNLMKLPENLTNLYLFSIDERYGKEAYEKYKEQLPTKLINIK